MRICPSVVSMQGLAVSRRSGRGTARQEAEGKRGLRVGEEDGGRQRPSRRRSKKHQIWLFNPTFLFK